MPDDLRKQIIEAIAVSGDDNYKRLLLLLLRVEEIFIEKIDTLADQMTVPVAQHGEDHAWVTAKRATETTVRSDAHKIIVSLLDKAIYAGFALLAANHFFN